jgi:hypothetical protein
MTFRIQVFVMFGDGSAMSLTVEDRIQIVMTVFGTDLVAILELLHTITLIRSNN